MRLTRQHVETPDEPDRPSHFNEDQNEYATRNNTERDFPVEPYTPHLGFMGAPPPDPIPVFITEHPPQRRLIKRANLADYTLGSFNSTAQQAGGADLRRTRMVISNNDADTEVLISSKQGDIAAACFVLGAGKTIELFHNDAVWIRPGTSGGGTVSSCSVLTEFEMDDND